MTFFSNNKIKTRRVDNHEQGRDLDIIQFVVRE
jgi:hypothetical protein